MVQMRLKKSQRCDCGFKISQRCDCVFKNIARFKRPLIVLTVLFKKIIFLAKNVKIFIFIKNNEMLIMSRGLHCKTFTVVINSLSR
jgi:hypothetical protein